MVIITEDGKKARVKKNEFYQTPLELAKLMARIGMWDDDGKGKRILDAGCGTGVFGIACRETFPKAHITGVDIDYDMSEACYRHEKMNYDVLVTGDYLDFAPRFYGLEDNFDLIIGNPPFSLAEKFIRKSMTMLNEKIGTLIFLLRLNFLGSQKRAKGLWKEFPVSSLYVLNARISFFNNGKSDDNEHGVYVWDKALYTPQPVLRWLEWR